MPTATFKVTVFRPNGAPFPGVTLRLLAPNNIDALPTLTGLTPPIKTDSEGKLVYSFQAAPGLPFGPVVAGIYTVQATYPGYTTATTQTANTFVGAGTYTLNMVLAPIDTDYEIQPPDADSLSAVLPIPIVVTAPENITGELRIVRASIETGGRISAIEIIPDELDAATFDISPQSALKPAFHAVADGQIFRTDPDFSAPVSVGFEIFTGNGSADLEETVELSVANFVPGGINNDLSSYRTVPYKWITPMKTKVVVFAGYYADVLIWPKVTEGQEADLRLRRRDYNEAGAMINNVSHTPPAGTFSTEKAAKVRLVSPGNAAARSEYWLYKNSDNGVVSEILTVIYR